MKKYFYLVVLFFILLGATWLRFFKLGQIPVSLYWDETAILLDARSIAETGLDIHSRPWYQVIFPSYGDFKLPGYIWLSAISFKLFGAGEWSLRLVSTLAGLSSIVVSYFLSLKLSKSKKIALAAAFTIAFAPWSVHFSRVAFEGHLAQLLVALSILLVFHSQKRPWLLLPSVLLGSLATYTYFSVRFVWPVVFIGAIFLENADQLKSFRKISRQALIELVSKLVLPLFIFWLLLFPMFNSPLYDQSNQFRLSARSILNSTDYPVLSNQLREQAGNTFLDRIFFHRHLLLIKELAINYSQNTSFNFLFVSGDSNLRHGTANHGLFLFPLLLSFLIGIYRLIDKQKGILVFLLAWWLIALLPASVPEDVPHALRSLNALVPLSIIIAYGLETILSWGWSKSKSKFSFFVASLYTLILIFSIISFSFHYFKTYPRESAYDWQDGYRELTEVISNEKDSVRKVWVDPFEDRLFLWLLAYGPYTSKEIQNLPKEDFRVTSIENISFEAFDWEKLATLDHKVMVVGQSDQMQSKLESAIIKPSKTFVISSEDNIEKFTAVIFEENI